ncbi:MAG: hypothetical protein IJM37_06785 [Lachnospiraceae bacterium]|nr:hypothetical protein [Lachnospiraceae bacterium]
MEYLDLQKSCLFSVLIPINFLVGDYIKECKIKGRKHWIIDGIIMILSLIVSVKLCIDKVDPYLSFILVGGVVVAIIQNSYIFRKKREKKTNIEMYLDILIGILILIIPHTNIAWKLLYSEMIKVVYILSSVIYTVWGCNKVAFGVCGLINSERK